MIASASALAAMSSFSRPLTKAYLLVASIQTIHAVAMTTMAIMDLLMAALIMCRRTMTTHSLLQRQALVSLATTCWLTRRTMAMKRLTVGPYRRRPLIIPDGAIIEGSSTISTWERRVRSQAALKMALQVELLLYRLQQLATKAGPSRSHSSPYLSIRLLSGRVS